MAQDYAKLKNAELETLLKQRGLPHTGKKADLVARLQDDDAKATVKVAVDHPEDEIDWDDDEPLDEPVPQVEATERVETNEVAGVPKADEPVVADTQTEFVTSATNGAAAPTTSSDTVTGDAAPAAETVDINVDAEIQARIARIDKFTNPNEPDSLKWAEEEKAKLRRLQKQGDQDFAKERLTSQTSNLDKALPIRRERAEKRKRDTNDEESARRGLGRGRRGEGGSRDDRRHHPYRNDRRNDRRPQKSGGGGGGGGGRGRKTGEAPEWMNEKDRAAAEARKNRFV